jgi:hypothetical protein
MAGWAGIGMSRWLFFWGSIPGRPRRWADGGGVQGIQSCGPFQSAYEWPVSRPLNSSIAQISGICYTLGEQFGKVYACTVPDCLPGLSGDRPPCIGGLTVI